MKILRPQKGHVHLQGMLKVLKEQMTEDRGKITPIPPDWLDTLCLEIARCLPKRCVIFFLSDFITPQVFQTNPPITELAQNRTLKFLVFYDPLEERLPDDLGIIRLFDPETQATRTFDTSNPHHQNTYTTHYQKARENLMKILDTLGTPVLVSTQDDPVDVLISWLSRPLTKSSRSG